MASSDSDHSDTDTADIGVELGFVRVLEQEEKWRLHRCYFPSKVGGKPAWLNPRDILSSGDLKCSNCGKTMAFLLQVYAPNDENENTFHRTVYLFCCKTPSCYMLNSSKPFKVFRCQLPRKNEFYNTKPPEYDSPQYFKSCKELAPLCGLCGLAASKVCSRCHEVSYCCKEHQIVHWKLHKASCGKECTNGSDQKFPAPFLEVLFPEYEIVLENEECFDLSDEAPAPDDVQDVSNVTFSHGELEKFATVNLNEKEFSAFRKATENSRDQILRYDKGGTPLWCSSENVVSRDAVPNCDCGATRHFEFQVMPQLLNHLEIENAIDGPSIDWGILAIYTCSADCHSTKGYYYSEYLHKQDFEFEEQLGG